MDDTEKLCGAKTPSGAPCPSTPEPGRRRCRLHGGAPGLGAPKDNQNAFRHGYFSQCEKAQRRGENAQWKKLQKTIAERRKQPR